MASHVRHKIEIGEIREKDPHNGNITSTIIISSFSEREPSSN